MSELQRFDDRVWDRFFDILYACDDTVSDDVVSADLQRARIDMRPAYKRLRQMIEQARAREQLALAQGTRAKLLDGFRDVVVPKFQNLRESLADFIARNFAGDAQVAHYQKLERAASEDDLRSLLEDLHRLALMNQPRDEDESRAE